MIEKLNEEQVEEFKNCLSNLKREVKIVFNKIPINSDPFTTDLWNRLQRVIDLYEEAVEKRAWNHSNDKFVQETLDEFARLRAEVMSPVPIYF